KGEINYVLSDGTIIGQYAGKLVKEKFTGFLLNVSPDVGEYVDAAQGKQLYHYGWQAYKVSTAKYGDRWRILPRPSVDVIKFFKTTYKQTLIDNLSNFQAAVT